MMDEQAPTYDVAPGTGEPLPQEGRSVRGTLTFDPEPSVDEQWRDFIREAVKAAGWGDRPPDRLAVTCCRGNVGGVFLVRVLDTANGETMWMKVEAED